MSKARKINGLRAFLFCDHFDKTKQILSNLDWTIEMSPNERDGLWEKFEDWFEDWSSNKN